MAFELVIVVCVGFGAAGVLLLLARPFGLKKQAQKFVPLVVALAMVSYQVWSRYSWADRMIAGLPEHSVVLSTHPKTSALEPWSFFVPMTGSVVVLDGAATMTHPGHPGLRLVTTKLYEQYQDTLSMPQLIDCNAGRRMVPDAGLELSRADLLTLPGWVEGRQPPELFSAACRS